MHLSHTPPHLFKWLLCRGVQVRRGKFKQQRGLLYSNKSTCLKLGFILGEPWPRTSGLVSSLPTQQFSQYSSSKILHLSLKFWTASNSIICIVLMVCIHPSCCLHINYMTSNDVLYYNIQLCSTWEDLMMEKIVFISMPERGGLMGSKNSSVTRNKLPLHKY